MKATLAHTLAFILSHLPLIMLLLALIIASIIVVMRGEHGGKLQNVNTFVALMMLMAVGIPCLWNFMTHTFLTLNGKHLFTWQANQLKYGFAIANLAIGFAAIIAFNASKGYRLAMTLIATFFFWGIAGGQLYIKPGQTNIMFYTYIMIPVVMMVLMGMYCKRARTVFTH